MDRNTELGLLAEIGRLHARKAPYLDEAVSRSPVWHYTDRERFEAEMSRIFRRLPQLVAHASELAEPGAFVTRDMSGLPLLATRDRDGEYHVFLNVCRHRGTRLVDDAAGCRHRFSCPYHAWTWNNRGELKGVPHEKHGFPGLDKSEFGLHRLQAEVRHGFLWAAPPGHPLDLDDYLAGLGADFEWFGADSLRVAEVTEQAWRANWKLLVEGGIESYHFRVAHRGTIGPYFCDNLSTYRTFGPHFRSILARREVADLAELPEDARHLRQTSNVLYTLFPTSSLLVQPDHVVLIQNEPIGPDETRARLVTLAPADDDREAHWQRNHNITVETLSEDFAIGESIQRGLRSGANEYLNFGRFEGALATFNQTVAWHLGEA